MRESVIYQDILEEGRQEGRQEEGVNLVLRLLTRRFGKLDEQTKSRIAALPLPLLEDLGEALLDFSQAADLDTWLAHCH
jgi:predicted transposase YdaD